jgi:hypothetical protein
MMKRLIAWIFVAALAAVALGVPPEDLTPGRVLVKVAPSAARAMDQGGGLLRLAPSTDDAPVLGAQHLGLGGWVLIRYPDSADTRALAAAWRRVPGVHAAQPSFRLRTLLSVPNDLCWNVLEEREMCYFEIDPNFPAERFMRLWHLDSINAFEGWSIWPGVWYTNATKPANAPLIAIIDTGCDMNHPDFASTPGGSTDTLFGGQLDHARSGQLVDGQWIPGAAAAQDTYGHGTHVTGLALAAGNNGGFAGFGVIGVGYAARGMILRVFDDLGQGRDFDAALAMKRAADQGAQIINLSVGTPHFSHILQSAVTYAHQRGSLVVAAANQSGAGGGEIGPIYPAANSAAICVNAHGITWATTLYTGTGTYIDVAAPGGDTMIDLNFNFVFAYCWSTAVRGPSFLSGIEVPIGPPYTENYAYLQGNSMATPVVAGAMGLYYGRFGLGQAGFANIRAARALMRSTFGWVPTAYGEWENTQGFGTLQVDSLLNEANTRGATRGGLEGAVYLDGTVAGGARIDVLQGATGNTVINTTTTHPVNGTYRIGRLTPGVYRVRAFAANRTKIRWVEVVAGSDTIGVDFWIGGFVLDETDPVVPTFEFAAPPSTSQIAIRQWAYDTETGIDRIVYRIGTTPGGAGVLPDTEIAAYQPVVTFTGLSLQNGVTYHVTATWFAGADAVIGGQPFLRRTTRSLAFTLGPPGRTVSGRVLPQGWAASLAGVPATIELRAPGQTAALETHTVTLAADGAFSFATARYGPHDLAAKGARWLRSVRASVNLSGAHVTGQDFELLAGDCDGSNVVDLADFLILAAAYDTASGDPGFNASADFTGDGAIDLQDFLLLAANYDLAGAP